jgi:hypothetical protein
MDEYVVQKGPICAVYMVLQLHVYTGQCSHLSKFSHRLIHSTVSCVLNFRKSDLWKSQQSAIERAFQLPPYEVAAFQLGVQCSRGKAARSTTIAYHVCDNMPVTPEGWNT